MPNLSLFSGNEAIAHAAKAAGCRVAAAYPGTPSTEIMETLASFHGAVNCEWSPNEKVAMEVAIGASIHGARAMCSMKHVGLNVAMDPLMTYTFVGPHGGFVVVVADDPGMHSSQNEQDNRNIAKFAHAALLEPSDSQEAYDMTLAAFDLSEEFRVPVFLRMTTRSSHCFSTVKELADPPAHEPKPYVKDIRRNVATPANARVMRQNLPARDAALLAAAEASPFNRVDDAADRRIGFVTSAVAYQYVKEVFPEFPVLKLGFTNPLPLGKVRDFAATVDRLVVVEELDPFLADQIKAAGISVYEPTTELRIFELNPDRMKALRAELLGGAGETPAACRGSGAAEPPSVVLPARPPALCAGCGHRGLFKALTDLKATITGDIGCYTLGAAPPLAAIETTICMGASIGAAIGMRKAGHEGRLAAVIGDSTFFHSGLTGLVDAVYNNVPVTVVVSDNHITAMTGHQQNPGSGLNVYNEPAAAIDIVAVAKAMGVPYVATVSPWDLEGMKATLAEAMDSGKPALVVVRGPCVLAGKLLKGAVPCTVDPAKCKACGMCFKLGCPSIVRGEPAGENRFHAKIEPAACTGCTLCQQVCKFDAISRSR